MIHLHPPHRVTYNYGEAPASFPNSSTKNNNKYMVKIG